MFDTRPAGKRPSPARSQRSGQRFANVHDILVADFRPSARLPHPMTLCLTYFISIAASDFSPGMPKTFNRWDSKTITAGQTRSWQAFCEEIVTAPVIRPLCAKIDQPGA
jgi:hypothetical protein